MVYDYATIEKQCLLDDKAIQRIIPEWPNVSPSRLRLIGLDSGADHPFGAVLAVVTERGIVVIAEYLERMKAISMQLPAIMNSFLRYLPPNRDQIRWAANKNEANLRLEFGLKGIGVIPAENKHEVGIQRVASWLHTGQLYFAYTVPRTIEQMRAYRYAKNLMPDGQKKKEQVFKQKDELPDGLRYLLMGFPVLPDAITSSMTESQQSRWDALNDESREQIEMWREFNKQEKAKDLEPGDQDYPLGSMFNSSQTPW